MLKTSTLLRLHRALVKRRYRLLYSSRSCGCPGPKGPSRERIDVVVEMKRRNPDFGCRKIAEQISNAFGIELDRGVVRRILIRYYCPGPDGGGSSWLAVIGHAKDSLRRVDLFRTESILLKTTWITLVIDVHTSRIFGLGGALANLDRIRFCQMPHRAIAPEIILEGQPSGHDSLFRLHRWRANPRILEVGEAKTVPTRPVRMLSSTG